MKSCGRMRPKGKRDLKPDTGEKPEKAFIPPLLEQSLTLPRESPLHALQRPSTPGGVTPGEPHLAHGPQRREF